MSSFAEEGFTVLRGFVPLDLCRFLSLNYRILVENDHLAYNDGQVEKGYAAYGLPISESLLETFVQPLSRAIGRPLYPTYTYTRFYLRDAVLKPHLDRPSCEISTTLTIDHAGAKPWPIFIEDKRGQAQAVELARGDILVYRGAERRHWREAMADDWQTQVFLHFVDQQGEYADFKFDTRPRLGAPIESRRIQKRPAKDQADGAKGSNAGS